MKNPYRLHKYGTLLLWVGVFVWVPYFAQRFAGQSPALMAYLPFHLLGVIGGSRLRASARKQLARPREKRKGYKLAAHVLVIASILVWVPYYGLDLFGRPVELQDFLVVHLTGIFSGTGLMAVGSLVQYMQKKRLE